jgi:hypothetical protein
MMEWMSRMLVGEMAGDDEDFWLKLGKWGCVGWLLLTTLICKRKNTVCEEIHSRGISTPGIELQ